MTRYAERTSVAPAKSRLEIERTLARYGATGFYFGQSGNRAMVGFEMNGRHIKFMLTNPKPDSEECRVTPTGKTRSKAAAETFAEQLERQRWRALALAIKAKLEIVESGITEFDEEFLAHIVLPSKQTVGQWLRPQIEDAYADGKMPPLLPWSGHR